MKMLKKLGIFLIAIILLCSFLSISVFATEAPAEGQIESEVENESSAKLDMNLGDPDAVDENMKLDFGKRIAYALQGTVTGMLMVFAVLTLLALIVSLSKVIFYTIPNRKAEKKIKSREAVKMNGVAAESAASAVQVAQATADTDVQAQDDGELAAVITAAIAAMIESGDYKNEFVGGFKVVSFKRSARNAWNKK